LKTLKLSNVKTLIKESGRRALGKPSGASSAFFAFATRETKTPPELRTKPAAKRKERGTRFVEVGKNDEALF